MGVQETAGGEAGVLYSHQEPLTNQHLCPQVNGEAGNTGHKSPRLAAKWTQGEEWPGLPSTCLSWWAVGAAVASWVLLPKARAQGGGRHHSCYPGPLSGHSQPCRGSSSQTMRVIFSQRFNTSQLARVQGGRLLHPARPDSRPSPVLTLPPASASLFVYHCFSAAPPKTAPPNHNIGKRKIKKIRVFEQRSKS